MKDIIIKGSRIKRELKFWLVSFLIAVIINIYAIIEYNTNWIEIFSQLHIVVIVSILIYILLILIRSVWFYIRHLMKKK